MVSIDHTIFSEWGGGGGGKKRVFNRGHGETKGGG
eukprot:COSAG05_NODE_2793_length_2630_cov_35.256815_2_plen_34_part_01